MLAVEFVLYEACISVGGQVGLRPHILLLQLVFAHNWAHSWVPCERFRIMLWKLKGVQIRLVTVQRGTESASKFGSVCFFEDVFVYFLRSISKCSLIFYRVIEIFFWLQYPRLCLKQIMLMFNILPIAESVIFHALVSGHVFQVLWSICSAQHIYWLLLNNTPSYSINAWNFRNQTLTFY
jgi:hypothetical protein